MEDPRILLIAVVLLGYALASARLDRAWVSMPAVMVAVGLIVGASGLGWLDFGINSETVRVIAEATLALMLFRDAARIGVVGVVRRSVLSARLLGIGLPVMIVVGALLGYVMFPSLGWVGAGLVAVMLAPTDAALGDQVVSDHRLPVWLRQGLNVESGLNDGLSVPVFLVLLTIATSHSWTAGAVAIEFVRQVGFGVIVGLAFGGLGGTLLRSLRDRGWLDRPWIGIAVVTIALASYIGSAVLGGSGFIGAFVGGLAFGTTARHHDAVAMSLIGQGGAVFDAVSFLLVGALLVPLALAHVTWQVVVYVVASLTLVRMASVFIAMAGTGAAVQTKAFMGWFGPRGLATVVFTVLLLDAKVPGADLIASIAVIGVAASVYAHGFSAPPLAGAYADWLATREDENRPEHSRVETSPTRREVLAAPPTSVDTRNTSTG